MKSGTVHREGYSHIESIDTMMGTADNYQQEDIRLLYSFARYIRSEGDIVEAGSWKGKATIALCLGLLHSKKRGYVWTIDPSFKKKQLSEREKEVLKQQLSALRLDTKIREIHAPSSYATKRWKRPIRLLYIDGNHDYQSTAAEIAYWSSWVVTGGIIAFRDGYGASSGVWKAISLHIFSRKDIVDIGTFSSICYVVLGRPSRKDAYNVYIKKKIAAFAHGIYTSSLSWSIKSFMVYKLLPVFLSTQWDTRMHNPSRLDIPT